MPTQLTTSTVSTALDYSPNARIAVLCDGSLAVLDYDGTSGHLYQVTSPTGTPATTSVQTFALAGATQIVGSVYVLNNGTTTSDVWVVNGSNAGTAGITVAHATYTASGASWSWDNTGTAPWTATAYMIPSIIWTGTTLIVASRSSSNYAVSASYTTTKAGTTGWATVFQLSSTSSSTGTHYYPELLHDAANACTVAVYIRTGDAVVARVIADSLTPSLANWSAETQLSSTSTATTGAANLSAVLDTANKNLHATWVDTGQTATPSYCKSTYTTTAVTAGTQFQLATGSTTARCPNIGIDSGGNLFLFWESNGTGTGDIEYVKIVSPYASANVSAITNETNASAANNTFPQVPTSVLSGYVPLMYLKGTASPWSVELDTSISAAGGGNAITLTDTLTATETAVLQAYLTGTDTATLSEIPAYLAVLTATDTLTASDSITLVLATTINLVLTDTPLVASDNITFQTTLFLTLTDTLVASESGTLQAQATFTDTGTVSDTLTFPAPGTGPGYLTVTTKSQTWSGGPTGSPGTETDVTYTDASNAGWSVGLIPAYGGDAISSWYEVDGGVVGTNETSLSTSYPDGHLHWLTQSSGAVWAGSEDKPFTLTEQTPVGTAFRRYYLGAWGPDANGFDWNVYACIYPGDPGFVAYRFDMVNPGASAIALAASDSIEIAVIGGLEQADTTWAPANGGYGLVGGTNTVGWPGTAATVEPDYVYIVPASASAVKLGMVTVKHTVLGAGGLGWGTVQTEYLQDANRLKIKVMGVLTSFPASTTQTIYAINVLRRNLVAADAIAIAADYLAPGTPTMTTGTYTTFSYDERAYVFAAASNDVTATLDLSPVHVTARYKPVLKITGYMAGSAPSLTWGSAQLFLDTDYDYLLDSAGSTLYIRLHFDVVTSGAVTGQRNNAALAIVPTGTTNSITLTDTLVASDTISFVAQAVLTDTAMVTETNALLATVTATDALTASDSITLVGSGPGTITLTDTLTVSDALQLASLVALIDTTTPVETGTLQSALVLTDVVLTASDSITLTPATGSAITLTDTLTVSESVAFVAQVVATDTDTLGETLALFSAISFTDPALAPTDSVTLTPATGSAVVLTDSLVPTDTLTLAAILTWPDAVTSSETLVLLAASQLTDTALAPSDSIVLSSLSGVTTPVASVTARARSGTVTTLARSGTITTRAR